MKDIMIIDANHALNVINSTLSTSKLFSNRFSESNRLMITARIIEEEKGDSYGFFWAIKEAQELGLFSDSDAQENFDVIVASQAGLCDYRSKALVAAKKAGLLSGDKAQVNRQAIAQHHNISGLSSAMRMSEVDSLFGAHAQENFDVIIKHKNPYSVTMVLIVAQKAGLLSGELAQSNRELIAQYITEDTVGIMQKPPCFWALESALATGLLSGTCAQKNFEFILSYQYSLSDKDSDRVQDLNQVGLRLVTKRVQEAGLLSGDKREVNMLAISKGSLTDHSRMEGRYYYIFAAALESAQASGFIADNREETQEHFDQLTSYSTILFASNLDKAWRLIQERKLTVDNWNCIINVCENQGNGQSVFAYIRDIYELPVYNPKYQIFAEQVFAEQEPNKNQCDKQYQRMADQICQVLNSPLTSTEKQKEANLNRLKAVVSNHPNPFAFGDRINNAIEGGLFSSARAQEDFDLILRFESKSDNKISTIINILTQAIKVEQDIARSDKEESVRWANEIRRDITKHEYLSTCSNALNQARAVGVFSCDMEQMTKNREAIITHHNPSGLAFILTRAQESGALSLNPELTQLRFDKLISCANIRCGQDLSGSLGIILTVFNKLDFSKNDPTGVTVECFDKEDVLATSSGSEAKHNPVLVVGVLDSQSPANDDNLSSDQIAQIRLIIEQYKSRSWEGFFWNTVCCGLFGEHYSKTLRALNELVGGDGTVVNVNKNRIVAVLQVEPKHAAHRESFFNNPNTRSAIQSGTDDVVYKIASYISSRCP